MIYEPKICTEDERLDKLLWSDNGALLYWYIFMRLNTTTSPTWLDRRWQQLNAKGDWQFVVTKWDVS